MIIENKPNIHIFNVGNTETVSINEWVKLCYGLFGKKPEIKYVCDNIPTNEYFPFKDYGYVLDVSKQKELMNDLKPLEQGLKESYEWYKDNKNLVRRKDYISYIEKNFK